VYKIKQDLLDLDGDEYLHGDQPQAMVATHNICQFAELCRVQRVFPPCLYQGAEGPYEYMA